jgi:Gram-negative porin
MKRVALLCMGLVLGAATVAEAQLTMQMSNGWSFTFAGNVNAFMTYETFSDDGSTAGVIVPTGGAESETRIRTGLLPAFAVFDAKGKEGNTDLGVHFGFAPQVNCAVGVHDCFGAQIDMRQVFLTVGGTWGQILAGRELGLFGRQNILTDQTLFGIGATGSTGVPADGSGGGTTLGRIGFGYNYPQFKAQMTYSTAAGRPFQLSVGLFEAAANGPYVKTEIPRLEAEGVYTSGNTKFWVGGTAQTNKNPGTDETASAYGASGGVRFGGTSFTATGSGFYGKGIGTTLMFSGGSCSGGTCGANGSDDLRNSYGFIGQLTFTPTNSKVTVAGSYGSNFLEASDTEGGDGKIENNLISGGIYYQATKSLKVVGEVNYATGKDDIDATEDNTSFAPAFGLMLFF